MRRRHLLTTLALAVSVLTGCGTEEAPRGTDPVPGSETGSETGPGAGSAGADVRLVEEGEGQLQLWISNQSFEDDPVRITLSIDGVPLVEQDFEVEGQHNWRGFPVALPPGDHTLEAVPDTGVTTTETFRTGGGGGIRHAVLDYWYYEDSEGRHFTWLIQDEPLTFA